jgi:hypothetical protein
MWVLLSRKLPPWERRSPDRRAETLAGLTEAGYNLGWRRHAKNACLRHPFSCSCCVSLAGMGGSPENCLPGSTDPQMGDLRHWPASPRPATTTFRSHLLFCSRAALGTLAYCLYVGLRLLPFKQAILTPPWQLNEAMKRV